MYIRKNNIRIMVSAESVLSSGIIIIIEEKVKLP